MNSLFSTTTLIVAATKLELPFFQTKKIDNFLPLFETQFPDTLVMITGIGTVQTVFYLTQVLQKIKVCKVLNVGIGGAYRHDFELGNTFHIIEDRFIDQIVETENEFRWWEEIGLEKNEVFHIGDLGHRIINELPKAKSVTSDTIHANPKRINQIKQKCNPDIESMEGAAVAYVCSRLNVSSSQIRSVSNYIGERDKKRWKIQESTENINQIAISIIQSKQ
ncbi:MAG TPA: hypothetical protein PK990_04745 [Salinivirgaceae bacterium]|nr:hypothetical protein [Salinivirgaceae bacterium]